MRHIIIRRDDGDTLEVAIQRPPTTKEGPNSDARSDVEEVSSDASHELKRSTYYVLDHGFDYQHEKGERESEVSDMGLLALARIPTCAVFHKFTTGRGVPHSFVSAYLFSSCLLLVLTACFLGFFRQWPALPRVVVRLLAYSS